jgi:ABC-type polysaccharide/polyol phosphate transport system ATPase subunit
MGSPTTADHLTAPAPARDSDRPVVIEARGIHKTFRVPAHRIDSLRERVTHPFTRVEYREHRALRDVSFDVRHGEFFGIVGRNGSGKSSLLKILASIYRADAGRVRTAGRVAPFIELGVGFNHELTARENAVLNGVLMGLTLRRARRNLDAVMEFAELEDFVDLELKNYSSGMLVRFAFAVMVHAEADIMLIDEVLAVGDAAFAQKCMDVFHEKRRAGKTIVLVTHDMTTVQTLCHRAMLLHDGELRFLGEPEDAALGYYRLNFASLDARLPAPTEGAKVVAVNARVVRAALRDGAGASVETVAPGDPLVLDVVVESARPLVRPVFSFHVRTDDGQTVFDLMRRLDGGVEAGRRIALAGPVENRLVPGRYSLDLYIREDAAEGGITVQGLRLLHFAVSGSTESRGLVTVDADVEPVLQEDGE